MGPAATFAQAGVVATSFGSLAGHKACGPAGAAGRTPPRGFVRITRRACSRCQKTPTVCCPFPAAAPHDWHLRRPPVPGACGRGLQPALRRRAGTHPMRGTPLQPQAWISAAAAGSAVLSADSDLPVAMPGQSMAIRPQAPGAARPCWQRATRGRHPPDRRGRRRSPCPEIQGGTPTLNRRIRCRRAKPGGKEARAGVLRQAAAARRSRPNWAGQSAHPAQPRSARTGAACVCVGGGTTIKYWRSSSR